MCGHTVFFYLMAFFAAWSSSYHCGNAANSVSNDFLQVAVTMQLITVAFAVITVTKAIEIKVDGVNDFKGVTGTTAEVKCEVSDIRDPLEECDWYSPDGKKYSGKVKKKSSRRGGSFRGRTAEEGSDVNENVKVIVDDGRDECILTIDRVGTEHSGPWECVAYEGRDEASKFVVIRPTELMAQFQLLLDADEKQLEVQRGDDVQIICPTNHYGDRTLCKFYNPHGKRYVIIGKHGEIYNHTEDGIEPAGDFDHGECGIIIRQIDFADSGTWTCEVLRKYRPGSSVIGSEVASTTFKVDVFRTSRLNGAHKELQGYREDDSNAAIEMEVEVNENTEEFTDFYWIVQRSLKLYEGDASCRDSNGADIRRPSGRSGNCYYARRRRRIGKRKQYLNGIVKYKLVLEIDKLTREDLLGKIFLVKDYREFHSTIDKFETMVVPSSRASRSLSGEAREDEEEENEESEKFVRTAMLKKVTDGEGCLIRDEFIEVGQSVAYAEFCVKLECQEDGFVDAKSMSESECRRRKPKRN